MPVGGMTDAAVLASPVEPGDFASRLECASRRLQTRWNTTPPVMPTIGPPVGFLRRRSNARAASRLIDETAAEFERWPSSEPEREAWRHRVRERLREFGHRRLGWPDGYRRLLFGDEFYESAAAFARDARAFDPSLALEDVGQALRNVWIGNSFQMLLDRPVELRPGLFGYSMLYPVTDNWLDDPEVSDSAKRSFNERFGQRLAGITVSPADDLEASVGRLIALIEQELPRERFPGVYASMLAIHHAQVRSLLQHDGSRLRDDELLEISFCTGGTSVLTD